MNFISPVPELNSIWIEKMPSGKPVKVCRAVTVGRVTVMLAENGRLYSPSAQRVAYMPGAFTHHEGWFRALKALGVLTQKQVTAHKAACDRRDEDRKKRYAAEGLAAAAKSAGLPLSKAQRDFIAKYATKQTGAA